MRFAIWATLLFVPCSVMACAADSAERDRQMKEFEARVRQLSTRCERLEERLVAVEAVERHRANTNANVSASDASAISARPDLPTVKATPDSPSSSSPETSPEPGRTADTNPDDSNRLMIVGEGTRVETRVAGDTHAMTTPNTAAKPNARAAKRSPSTVPDTSPSGAKP